MKPFIPMLLPRSIKWMVTLFYCSICSVSIGQSTYGGSSFWSQVRYGGGLGLSFGKEAVQIGIAPSAIYQANQTVAIGLGLNYTYSKIYDTKFSAVGGSLIGLINPIPSLQISAEFEELYVSRDFQSSVESYRDSYWLPALYMGLGYSTGPVTFGIRYDVLYNNERSLYSDPWIPFVRVYF